MSHERAPPLNAIILYTELLQEEATDQGLKDFLPDLQKVHGAAKHLLTLINDVLDLAKIESGKTDLIPETFDIVGVVQDVVTTIQPLAQKNAVLEVRCPPDLGTMYADLTKVRQSLFNLLSNACKFTEQGAICCDVARTTAEGRDWITFQVTDSGIGITPEQLARLFEPFSQPTLHHPQVRRDRPGAGDHAPLLPDDGGRYRRLQHAGRGSVFRIRLLWRCSLQGSQPPTPPNRRGGGGNTVLVIDDDPAARDVLKGFRARKGFRVERRPTAKKGCDWPEGTPAGDHAGRGHAPQRWLGGAVRTQGRP